MNGLHLADNLTLPIEAITQTFAILAKRGVGKTYTALVMVEEFLKLNLRVVVADPVGVCWGLRAGADGKSPGLPIIVLGGEHGDLPLEVTSGNVIADLVVDEELSAVLDLSLMRKGEQVRFMTDFAERLYHRNRSPLHLVLDEADIFAPQRPLPGQQRMLGAVEDLVRRGRARGLGITLVTQRSAVLNKDVLTQVEVLIALRTIAPQDRGAIDEWVKVHGTPEERDELMKSLPSLPIGTAWFWSSGWLDEFKRIDIRRRDTYDSSATPKVGARIKPPKKLAKVDLARLRKLIATTEAKDKSENTRDTHQRPVKRLRHNTSTAQAKVVRVEVPIIKREDIEHLEKVIQTMADLGEKMSNLSQVIASSLANAKRYHKTRSEVFTEALPEATSPRTIRAQNDKEMEEAKLSTGERKILSALAKYPQGRNKTQVAILTGYSHRGGAFNNYLSSLRTKGLINRYDDRLILTEKGASTGTYEQLPTGQALIEYWLKILGKAERSILTVLVDAYPSILSKEEVAYRAGYEVHGGGFNNAISKLRTLELIRGRGELQASDEFFNG